MKRFSANSKDKSDTGRLPKLHKAAYTKDIARLKRLLSQPSISVNQPDSYGRTVLHYACMSGSNDVVNEIIHRANPIYINARDNQGRTPIFMAAESNNMECIELMTCQRADVNVKDNNGTPLLHYAVRNNNIDIVRHMIVNCSADIKLTDRNGFSVLHISAALGFVDMTKTLVSLNAQIDPVDWKKRTPLMAATAGGFEEIVRILLNYNASVSIADQDGMTPDDWAKKRHNKRIQQLIKENKIRRKFLSIFKSFGDNIDNKSNDYVKAGMHSRESVLREGQLEPNKNSFSKVVDSVFMSTTQVNCQSGPLYVSDCSGPNEYKQNSEEADSDMQNQVENLKVEHVLELDTNKQQQQTKIKGKMSCSPGDAENKMSEDAVSVSSSNEYNNGAIKNTKEKRPDKSDPPEITMTIYPENEREEMYEHPVIFSEDLVKSESDEFLINEGKYLPNPSMELLIPTEISMGQDQSPQTQNTSMDHLWVSDSEGNESNYELKPSFQRIETSTQSSSASEFDNEFVVPSKINLEISIDGEASHFFIDTSPQIDPENMTAEEFQKYSKVKIQRLKEKNKKLVSDVAHSVQDAFILECKQDDLENRLKVTASNMEMEKTRADELMIRNAKLEKRVAELLKIINQRDAKLGKDRKESKESGDRANIEPLTSKSEDKTGFDSDSDSLRKKIEWLSRMKIKLETELEDERNRRYDFEEITTELEQSREKCKKLEENFELKKKEVESERGKVEKQEQTLAESRKYYEEKLIKFNKERVEQLKEIAAMRENFMKLNQEMELMKADKIENSVTYKVSKDNGQVPVSKVKTDNRDEKKNKAVNGGAVARIPEKEPNGLKSVGIKSKKEELETPSKIMKVEHDVEKERLLDDLSNKREKIRAQEIEMEVIKSQMMILEVRLKENEDKQSVMSKRIHQRKLGEELKQRFLLKGEELEKELIELRVDLKYEREKKRRLLLSEEIKNRFVDTCEKLHVELAQMKAAQESWLGEKSNMLEELKEKGLSLKEHEGCVLKAQEHEKEVQVLRDGISEARQQQSKYMKAYASVKNKAEMYDDLVGSNLQLEEQLTKLTSHLKELEAEKKNVCQRHESPLQSHLVNTRHVASESNDEDDSKNIVRDLWKARMQVEKMTTENNALKDEKRNLNAKVEAYKEFAAKYCQNNDDMISLEEVLEENAKLMEENADMAEKYSAKLKELERIRNGDGFVQKAESNASEKPASVETEELNDNDGTYTRNNIKDDGIDKGTNLGNLKKTTESELRGQEKEIQTDKLQKHEKQMQTAEKQQLEKEIQTLIPQKQEKEMQTPKLQQHEKEMQTPKLQQHEKEMQTAIPQQYEKEIQTQRLSKHEKGMQVDKLQQLEKEMQTPTLQKQEKEMQTPQVQQHEKEMQTPKLEQHEKEMQTPKTDRYDRAMQTETADGTASKNIEFKNSQDKLASVENDKKSDILPDNLDLVEKKGDLTEQKYEVLKEKTNKWVLKLANEIKRLQNTIEKTSIEKSMLEDKYEQMKTKVQESEECYDNLQKKYASLLQYSSIVEGERGNEDVVLSLESIGPVSMNTVPFLEQIELVSENEVPVLQKAVPASGNNTPVELSQQAKEGSSENGAIKMLEDSTQQECYRLNEEMNIAEMKLEGLYAENNDMRTRLEDVVSTAERLKDEKTRYYDQLIRMNEELHLIRNENIEYMRNIESKEDRCAILCQENIQLSTEIENMNETIIVLRRDYAICEDYCSRVKADAAREDENNFKMLTEHREVLKATAEKTSKLTDANRELQKELEKSRNEFDETEKSLEETRNELRKAKNENQKTQEQYRKLQIEMAKSYKDLEELRGDAEKQSSRNRALQLESTDLHKEYEIVKSDLDEARQELKRISTFEDKLAEVTGRFEDSEKDKNALLQRYELANTEVENFKETTSKLREDVVNATKLVNKCLDESAYKDKEIEDERNKYNEFSEEKLILEQRFAESNRQLERFSRNYVDMKQRYLTTRSEIESLKEALVKYDELEKKCGSLEKDKQELLDEHSKLSKKTFLIEEDIEQLQNENRFLKDEITDVDLERKKAIVRIKELDEELTECKNRVKVLDEKLEKLEAEKIIEQKRFTKFQQDYRKEKYKIDSELMQSSLENEQLKKEIKNLKKDITTKEKSDCELMSKIDKLQTANQDLKKQLSLTKMTAQKSQSQLRDLQRSTSYSVDKIQTMSSRMDSLQAENTQLNEKVLICLRENDQISRSLKFTEYRLDISQTRNNELWTQYRESRKEFQNLDWAQKKKEMFKQTLEEERTTPQTSLEEIIHGKSQPSMYSTERYLAMPSNLLSTNNHHINTREFYTILKITDS